MLTLFAVLTKNTGHPWGSCVLTETMATCHVPNSEAALWPQMGPRSTELPAREGYTAVHACCQHRMDPQPALAAAAPNLASRHVSQPSACCMPEGDALPACSTAAQQHDCLCTSAKQCGFAWALCCLQARLAPSLCKELARHLARLQSCWLPAWIRGLQGLQQL